MSRRLPALERAGFIVHHVTGSHYILKHPRKAAVRVTLPWHNRELKRGTRGSIIEQAGYTVEEFTGLL